MATYEIQNYIKLICIRLDHFESYIVDEVNCSAIEEVEAFIRKYDGNEELKIIMVQMNNMEVITFDDVKKVIKNAHMFDYLRHLVSEGHKMINIDDANIFNLGWIINYMLCAK